MAEFFVITNSFGVPFFSDTDEKGEYAQIKACLEGKRYYFYQKIRDRVAYKFKQLCGE